MYREEILDHYKNPRNSGKLEDGVETEGENPSCGDYTHVFIEVENGRIDQVRHETDGCAISTAAASVLTQQLENIKVEKVEDLDREWMIDKLGIEVSPMRVKCAVLGLKTVQEALKDRF